MARRHPLGAAVLALVPAIALVGGLPFANRLEPVVLGLPFLLFWILAWVAATPVFLGVAYLLAGRRADGPDGGADR